MDFVIDDGTGNLPGTKAEAPEEFTGINAGTASVAILGSEVELFMMVFLFHYRQLAPLRPAPVPIIKSFIIVIMLPISPNPSFSKRGFLLPLPKGGGEGFENGTKLFRDGYSHAFKNGASGFGNLA
jgi:hypothetical protein